MAYTKHNFKTGDKLYAAQLNEMDEQIAKNEEAVNSLNEEIAAHGVTPQMFGAYGDGVNDDSDAIQVALDKGGVVYLPAGRYKITKTLTIGSNTVLMGAGDNSVIFLGDDGANLTPHFWYPADIEPNYPSYFPYITTAENARGVRISRIRVEGNTETASANLHVGIAAESATDVQVDNVSVWKINYFPENAPPRPSGQYRTGWNIAFLRCNRAELANSTIQYGAYECVRVGPHSENVWVHDCLMEWGWRTGFQVIRGCDNVVLERCTINQDDFDAYDTNSCVTLHAAPDAHIGRVFIRNCDLTGKLFTGTAGGAAISEVAYGVDELNVEDTAINVIADELAGLNLYGNTNVRRCKIHSNWIAIVANAYLGGEKFTVEDSTIITEHEHDNPGVMIYGDAEFRRCVFNTAATAIRTNSHNENATHLIVEGCNITINSPKNGITIFKAGDGYGAKSFDIIGNVINNKVYIDQTGGTVERKCTIADNTITPHPNSGSKRSIQIPSTATTTYKLLAIRDNIFMSGIDGATLNKVGIVVAIGNNAAGCTNGITGTNEKNIIKDNILPGTN